MKYFTGCKTIDDVKSRYHELCKKLHPDNGGNGADFVAMRKEYKTAFETYKNIHVNAAGETYEKETNETPEQYADIIDRIIHCEGVKIEIIGSWIWITGNTFTYKDLFHEIGFSWSKSKKAWYYAGEKLEGKRRGRYSMKQLRDKWGSQDVETEKQERIA